MAPIDSIDSSSTTNTRFSDAMRYKNLENIMEQNSRWMEQINEKDPEFFNRLGAGHNPRYLWIGCADARVPANEIMSEGAGSVFVHRNVGNQVLSTDMSILSTIQYAVDYLKVPHIIVCGHYDCGAVKAASEAQALCAPLDNWLTSIRDVKNSHRSELMSLEDPEKRRRRLVELNVIQSCLNVYKLGTVQRKRVETHADPESAFTTPRVHALVYDPSVGKLESLDVDFKAILDEFSSDYDIYGRNSMTIKGTKRDEARIKEKPREAAP